MTEVHLQDVGFLSKLEKLTSLKLHQTSVRDWSSLQGLLSIAHLELMMNKVADLSFIANIPALETLSLIWQNDIKTLPNLSNAKHLNSPTLSTV